MPIVRVDGALLAFEALLRWRHPERGLLLPQEFLSVVGGSPLSGPVAAWVLEPGPHRRRRMGSG